MTEASTQTQRIATTVMIVSKLSVRAASTAGHSIRMSKQFVAWRRDAGQSEEGWRWGWGGRAQEGWRDMRSEGAGFGHLKAGGRGRAGWGLGGGGGRGSRRRRSIGGAPGHPHRRRRCTWRLPHPRRLSICTSCMHQAPGTDCTRRCGLGSGSPPQLRRTSSTRLGTRRRSPCCAQSAPCASPRAAHRRTNCLRRRSTAGSRSTRAGRRHCTPHTCYWRRPAVPNTLPSYAAGEISAATWPGLAVVQS